MVRSTLEFRSLNRRTIWVVHQSIIHCREQGTLASDRYLVVVEPCSTPRNEWTICAANTVEHALFVSGLTVSARRWDVNAQQRTCFLSRKQTRCALSFIRDCETSLSPRLATGRSMKAMHCSGTLQTWAGLGVPPSFCFSAVSTTELGQFAFLETPS